MVIFIRRLVSGLYKAKENHWELLNNTMQDLHTIVNIKQVRKNLADLDLQGFRGA